MGLMPVGARRLNGSKILCSFFLSRFVPLSKSSFVLSSVRFDVLYEETHALAH
jgi:hypothetical protein